MAVADAILCQEENVEDDVRLNSHCHYFSLNA
jgi:hypothetical protein